MADMDIVKWIFRKMTTALTARVMEGMGELDLYIREKRWWRLNTEHPDVVVIESAEPAKAGF